MPLADNPSATIAVPTNEYPAGLVFYKMEAPAGILQGLHEDNDISSKWKMVVVDDYARREAFLRKYRKKLTMRFQHVPDDFGRLLAKIGYGQILTVLDLDDFHPICPPYILGEKRNVSYIVGGGEPNPDPVPGIGYSLRTAVKITRQSMALIAKVRLYANIHSPEYEVAVGHVVGSENMTRVTKKLELPNPDQLPS
jgi:hypothetical protein